MTTKITLRHWFEEGVKNSKKYMLVLCDTFDYDIYPVYTDTVEQATMRKNNPGPMQKIMEIYDLRDDMNDQVRCRMVMAL